MAYANGTQVSPGRTRDQIEALLSKFGASQFGYQCRSDAAIIGFEYEGLTILFTIPIPEAKKFEYSYDMLQGQIAQAKLSANGSKCLPLLPPDQDVIDVDHTPS